MIRRTDPGNDGPIDPSATIPDVLSIMVTGWAPTQPTVDPYVGLEVDGSGADIFRLDVVVDGLVNPPGTLGLGATPFDPFRFGNSPVYGFVELNVDRDNGTGGELGGAANLRYLANVGRFATVPQGATLSQRMARSAADLDNNFNSSPQVERSGQDFSLNLCGCFDVSIVSEAGTPDGMFDPGDTWVMSGRFFQRADGYEMASAMFGGTFFGLFDPVVNVQFSHDVTVNQTTISLVFPLTMAGAAALAGQPQQPIDLDLTNHTSVVEALDDIIVGASEPLFGPTLVLTQRWAGVDPNTVLDPTHWQVSALIGMSYTSVQPTLYVWTDVAGDQHLGDFDGSGIVLDSDRLLLTAFIQANDGTSSDGDGVVNGVFTISNPGTGFSVFDLDGNERVDATDAALVPVACLGDADGNGVVDFADVTSVVANWLADYRPLTGPGDAWPDGLVNFMDITTVVSNWLRTCP